MEKECTLLEINPLVITQQGRLVPLDVKIDVDDNALIRQKDIVRLRDFPKWTRMKSRPVFTV
jgi:succinyl-CoA synthetase beta subunit